MEYGTGWGRTKHIITRDGDRPHSVCGAALDNVASAAEVESKPLCKSCAKRRRVPLCSRCHGTGQEPEAT